MLRKQQNCDKIKNKTLKTKIMIITKGATVFIAVETETTITAVIATVTASAAITTTTTTTTTTAAAATDHTY